jgi:hypothetical protein
MKGKRKTLTFASHLRHFPRGEFSLQHSVKGRLA